MTFSRFFTKIKGLMLFPFVLCLLGVILVACGSTNTSSGSAASASASATCTATPNATQAAAARARGNASGTIQSVQSGSLVVKTAKKGNVNVSIASTTRISQVETVALSALKEGASASLQVKQDSAGNYTATIITVTNVTGQTFPRGTGNGNGNFTGRGRAGCGAGRFGQGGQGGANAGQTGSTGNTNTRFVFGTIGQITGQQLTVTDTQGNDYTVAVDSSTRIIQTVSATANDLKTGLTVAVIGTAINNGAMTAQSITISALGTFQSNATPTATNS